MGGEDGMPGQGRTQRLGRLAEFKPLAEAKSRVAASSSGATHSLDERASTRPAKTRPSLRRQNLGRRFVERARTIRIQKFRTLREFDQRFRALFQPRHRRFQTRLCALVQ